MGNTGNYGYGPKPGQPGPPQRGLIGGGPGGIMNPNIPNVGGNPPNHDPRMGGPGGIRNPNLGGAPPNRDPQLGGPGGIMNPELGGAPPQRGVGGPGGIRTPDSGLIQNSAQPIMAQPVQGEPLGMAGGNMGSPGMDGSVRFPQANRGVLRRG